MDEFGVLTERFGLKPQGKGAPMAATKRTVNSNNNSRGVAEPYDLGASGDYDDIFGGNFSTTNQSAAPGGGSSFDYDSFFFGSNANSSSFNAYGNDDIFGGMPGVKSSNSAKNDSDDIFGSFASPPKQSAPVDDLLGDFVGGVAKPKGSSGNNTSNFDDLIPGFGPNVAPNNGLRASKHSARQSTFTSSEDPFIVLESAPTSTSGNAYASSDLFSDPLEGLSKPNRSGGTKPPRVKSPPRATKVSVGSKAKRSDVSSIDELEDFARGGVQNNANGRSNSRLSEQWAGTSANRTGSHSEGDLESFFAGPRSVSAPRPRATTTDSIFDAPTYNREGPRPAVPQKKSSGNSPSIKKSTSASGIYDDLSSMFEEAHIFENFEEVEDESEERKNLRRGRMQRTRERMLKAVSDMNQRDFQSQQEQEEKRRIAETLDVEIKRWAAGKEGNMRAMLSSLQFVLWPECGWEPVSLTDIITSASVKKVYRKATLCVHPDKVQQKGATLEQKFTAEKVFDILQEAWKKFNKEELS